MPKINGETGTGVQSVILALRIVEEVAKAREGVGVSPLARVLGTTKPRIYRHLQTLVQEGYLAQSKKTGRYQVGSGLMRLGREVAETTDFSMAAQPYFRELRERVGQSCVLSQLEHTGARIVLALSGRSPIEIGVKPGSLLGFHNSAQGKAILAFTDPLFRERVLAEPMPASTARTITDAGILAAELEAIRARGWAVAPDESAMGLNALAAPVFGETGDVLGAIAVIDLTQFLSAEPEPEQLEAVMAAAARISAELGYRDPGERHAD